MRAARLWLLPVVLCGPAFAETLAAEEKPSAQEALHQLFARAWEHDLLENPVRASLLGERRWNDRWPDLSLAAIERRHSHDREVLAALRGIERAGLSPADQVSFDLFSLEYRTRVEEFAFKTYLVPFDQRTGIHATYELAEQLRFETEKDYRDWLVRLHAFPQLMDGTLALLRQGMRMRVLQPKVIVRRVLAQVEKQLAGKPEDSGYYAPFKSLPPALPAGTRETLAREAREAVAGPVREALERFGRFLREEYLPAAFEAAGIWQWPRGEETYAFLARKFTTLDLTPQEIHRIGLAEVERIRSGMEAIKSQVGFQGTLKEFFTFLRTDPRFYFEKPEELLTAYRAMAKRIDPVMVKVLRRLPRAPYGVEPMPEISAPHTTTAYYLEPAADGSRPGTYFVNLYQPRTRPRYEMMALSLHEAVPGHHLQISLAMELDLPDFRRFGGYTAFVEGWGLYAEHLGAELGLYDDPYSRFGQLTYEMWRAVRLVVDTGIHVLRWDRQRAIDFFLENAAKTETDVINEVDRYIGWPGQALAYKIGEMKLKQLRRRAEERLGNRFDARDFHEAVLKNGAVTLDVLERGVEEWLAGRARSP